MFRHLLVRNWVSSTLFMRAWQKKNTSILGQETNIRYLFNQQASPLSFAGLHQSSTAVNERVDSVDSVSLLDVKIPYLSQLDPQPLVQIPYVPDFWNSSSPSIEPVSKETLPKLLVVAGAGTHHGGGPSHNLLDISSEPENGSLDNITAGSPSRRPEEKGLWDDMADDIGLPPPKDVKNTIWKLFS